MTKYVESFPNNIVKPRCLELGWAEYHGWLELI